MRRLQTDYLAQLSLYEKGRSRRAKITSWMESSVDQSLLTSARYQMLSEEKTGPRELFKCLKLLLAPNDDTEKLTAAKEYREVLQRATKRGINATAWYWEWKLAFFKARAFNIPELEGLRGRKEFLSAVKPRIAPDWAKQQLSEVQRYEAYGQEEQEKEPPTMLQYAHWLGIHIQDESSSDLAVFSTPKWPASSSGKESGAAEGADQPRSSNQGARKRGYPCPCRPADHSFHAWKPTDCDNVRKAWTGRGSPRSRAGPARCEEIRERLKDAKFDSLRSSLLEKWGNPVSGEPQKGKPKAPLAYPGSINASVIDPSVMRELLNPTLVCSVSSDRYERARHPLSDSTLIDNCGAVHLVNNEELLVEGSFKLVSNEVVLAGTASFPIRGKGKRIIRRVLDGAKGSRIEDLILEDVAFVEGFYMNIEQG